MKIGVSVVRVYAQINNLKKGLVLDNKPEAGTLPQFKR